MAAAKGGPSGGRTAVLLAPLDVRPWLAEAKDDRHGIGYSGIQEDRVGEMKGKARSTGVHGLFGQVGPNYTGSHSHVHARTHTHIHTPTHLDIFCRRLVLGPWKRKTMISTVQSG